VEFGDLAQSQMCFGDLAGTASSDHVPRTYQALAAGRFNASSMAIDGPHPMPGWGTAARHW